MAAFEREARADVVRGRTESRYFAEVNSDMAAFDKDRSERRRF